jgi:hypothetical protein
MYTIALINYNCPISLVNFQCYTLDIKNQIHYHHRPINVPTDGAQAFLIDYT